MSQTMLLQATVYLLAAVIAVPIAKRLGLGAVLGYLLAGVVIGPFVLGFVGAEGEDVLHVAEFGVVMMLFVVGLELEPALLWRLRVPIVGLGGLQVLVTTALVAALAMALGLVWQMALAIGMIAALSSTAIVLQVLAEKGLLKTEAGQSAFAVLLFQDIAVIPMLALFPLLATLPKAAGDDHGGATLIAHLPAWAQTLAVLGAVAAIVLGGRFVIRPVLRFIAQTRLREVFTAAALLLVFGIALLMSLVGLSPALGTFLAGVVLANSEYRHELESDIEPFKGLLLGLFFIAVGASINFALIMAQPLLILGLVGGFILLKAAILFGLGRVFKLALDQRSLFALSLAQIGEFAFVLLSFATQEGVLDDATAAPLVAAVALSMAATPLLLTFGERVLLPRFGTREAAPERSADAIHEDNPVVIAGFGGFGSTVGRLLQANGIATTVLDIDSDQVDSLRKLGLKVYYGDALRHDLLFTAGTAKARLLIVALDTPERTLELVHTARRHFPQLTILARAFDWSDAHELLNAGVDYVYRESLDTALRLGTDALRLLGLRAYSAQRAAQTFLRHDEESLRHLAALRGDGAVYISAARRRIAELEQILRTDRQAPPVQESGWDSDAIRDDVLRNVAAFAPKS